MYNYICIYFNRQSLRSRSDRRMNINYEIVTRICCGTTCVSSEEYILGTVPSNSIASPLRMQTRSERKKKGKGSMLPPHRKVIYYNFLYFFLILFFFTYLFLIL